MPPTTPMNDYYVVFEVSATALHEDIKASFHRLVRLHHPDKNNGSREATVKTQLINEAWETLRDPTKRSTYHHKHHPTPPLICPCQTDPSASTPFTSSSFYTTRRYYWYVPDDDSDDLISARFHVRMPKDESVIREYKDLIKVYETRIAGLYNARPTGLNCTHEEKIEWLNKFNAAQAMLKRCEDNLEILKGRSEELVRWCW